MSRTAARSISREEHPATRPPMGLSSLKLAIHDVSLIGHAPARFVEEYSVDGAWAPEGRIVVYSGPDIGTTFSVKAVTKEGAEQPVPALTLTRGARHLTFLPGGRTLLFLQGEIQHKNSWQMDLVSGAKRQLTNVGPDFDIGDFDVSPDGRGVVLLDLPRP